MPLDLAGTQQTTTPESQPTPISPVVEQPIKVVTWTESGGYGSGTSRNVYVNGQKTGTIQIPESYRGRDEEYIKTRFPEFKTPSQVTYEQQMQAAREAASKLSAEHERYLAIEQGRQFAVKDIGSAVSTGEIRSVLTPGLPIGLEVAKASELKAAEAKTAQGRPMTREQAILSGRTDAPGASQFERIQSLIPGSGPTPPPQSGSAPQLQPGSPAPQPGQSQDINVLFPSANRYNPMNQGPQTQDPYWAIHKEDAPRSDLGGKIFHGGSPVGKFIEAIQDPSLAYEYAKFDINTIMGKSPSGMGIQQARETFLETVNKRQENYGLPGAAAIGVAGSLPVQAYAGGALFKGGTLAARIGLKEASGAVGSNIVSRGLLAGEKAVEPLAIVGGVGIAGKELVTTYQKEGGAGAAAQAAIMAGSLPFAMAGWKGTGNLYSKVQTVGRTERPAPITPEVLSGKQQLPMTGPGATPKDVVKSFNAPEGTTRAYHATGEAFGEKFTVQPKAHTPKVDVVGLDVSPHQYGTSSYFLRLKPEYGGGIDATLRGLAESEPIKPQVADLEIIGARRLPGNVRGYQEGFDPVQQRPTLVSKANEFVTTEAEKGIAWITPKLEADIVGKGSAEVEGAITPGTTFKKVDSRYYFKYQGRNIPIDKYKVSNEPGTAVIPKNQPQGTENYGYQRTTIPPVSSNIVGSLNIPTLSGTARAEPSQDDYITAYNAAREAARQQTYGNDITAIHEPQSPAKVDTLRGKKQAEDLADTIMKDLKGGGMNVRYNKRTATIEKVPESFDINQGAEPILDIQYFNKAKVQQSTAFDKGFQSEDLTGMNILSLDTRRTQQPGDISILAKYYGNNPADVPILFPDAEFGGRSENFNKEMRYRKIKRARENIRESQYRPNSGPYTPLRRTDRTSRSPDVMAPYRPDYKPSGTPYTPYGGTSRTPTYKPPGTPTYTLPGTTRIPKKKTTDDDTNTAEIKINNKYFKTVRKSPIASASIDLSGVRKSMGLITPKKRWGRK